MACVVLVLWVLGSAQQDPYIKASLELQGAVDHGGQLFRINCAGCHGLAGPVSYTHLTLPTIAGV